jgi:hypothetical protein
MLLKQKKIVTVSLLVTTLLGVIFSQSNQTSNTQIYATTSTLTTTLNHNLTPQNPVLDLNSSTLTSIFNSTSTINGSSVNNAFTSITGLRVRAYTSQMIGLELAQTDNSVQNSSLTINFNSEIIKSNSFTFTHASVTGSSSIRATITYINLLGDQVTLAFEDANYLTSGVTLSFPSSQTNSTIKVIGYLLSVTLRPTIGQNRWAIDSIGASNVYTFTGTNQQLIDGPMKEFSILLNSYTGAGCTPQSNETVATSTQVDDVLSIYNSMTNDQKELFKTNYPNAWGRLQLLANKANKIVS